VPASRTARETAALRVVSGLGLPDRGERRVEVLVELACRVVRDVQIETSFAARAVIATTAIRTL
jgi:hypothetical protein